MYVIKGLCHETIVNLFLNNNMLLNDTDTDTVMMIYFTQRRHGLVL